MPTMATSIFTLLLLGVIIDSSSNLAAGEESNSICSNAACASAAKDLLSNMDEAIKPCDDFYKFVCEKFHQNAVLSKDEAQVTTLTDIQIQLDNHLKKLLEESIRPNSPKYEIFLKKYYQLCMDTEIIEETGAAYLLNYLYKLGGWPLIGQTWNENIDLTKFLVLLRLEIGLSLFTMTAMPNDSDSSQNVLVMGKKNALFPKEFYKDDKHKNKIDAMRQFIINFAKGLTGNIYLENLEKDVEDILNFDKNLAEISSSGESSQRRQEKITLDKLVALFNKTIRVDELINGILKIVNLQARKDEPINVYEYSFFIGMADLLEKTPKRVVINHLLWQLVKSKTDVLPKRFGDFGSQFLSAVYGMTLNKARWSNCVNMVSDDFPMQIGAMYIKSYFGQSAKAKIEELIKELMQSFQTMIQSRPWLQDVTKARALEKLLYMRNISGYPDSIKDGKLLDEMFENVTEPQTFLGATIIATLFLNAKNLNLLKIPADPKNPDFNIATANAKYVGSINSIIVQAGILLPPFFSESQPMYLNYGGIGSVIGHEITHGFDDDGKNYDKDGNIVNWWEKEDLRMFMNVSQCFVDQYNNFVVEELNEHVNGRLTLGENIADNGGIRAAFQAYQKWIEKHGNEPLLPGLTYSPLQLFFINIGRSYCEKALPEASLMALKDSHTPGRFRVLGMLQNFEKFSEVFNCPIGSPMNPTDKCRVW